MLSVIYRGCVWEIDILENVLCLGNRRLGNRRLGNRRLGNSIAAEVEGVGGQPVSAQTIRRTLHQISLHGCRLRRKPLLKMMHKNESPQTVC